MNNESKVAEYIETLSLLKRDKEEVSNVILGYMTDCQEKDKRIAELTAHVWRLREGLELIKRHGKHLAYTYEACNRTLNTTPAQSLAIVRSEAIRAAHVYAVGQSAEHCPEAWLEFADMIERSDS